MTIYRPPVIYLDTPPIVNDTVYNKMESTLSTLLESPIFLSSLCSVVIVQVLKTAIAVFKKLPSSGGRFSMEMLWKTGGMPSSHSALVTSLSTSVGFVEGFSSPIFIVMAFLASIVVRDAVGVRRSAGEQARVINMIIRESNISTKTPINTLREVDGHTIPDVAVGITLGFFVAVAFCNL